MPAIVVYYALAGAMIVWAIYMWGLEWKGVKDAYGFKGKSVALSRLLMDILITSSCTKLFGLSGTMAGPLALFMSNMLSLKFFIPRGQSCK